MLQKEVSDRMVAPPDTADYGLLYLAVQGKAVVERLFDVPGRVRAAAKSDVLRPPPHAAAGLAHPERKTIF